MEIRRCPRSVLSLSGHVRAVIQRTPWSGGKRRGKEKPHE